MDNPFGFNTDKHYDDFSKIVAKSRKRADKFTARKVNRLTPTRIYNPSAEYVEPTYKNGHVRGHNEPKLTDYNITFRGKIKEFLNKYKGIVIAGTFAAIVGLSGLHL